MKSTPILFSAPMVRAILAGAKSQTRRIVKPQPVESDFGLGGKHPAFVAPQTHKGYLAVSVASMCADKFAYLKRLPFGNVGDQLWVRETWAPRGTAASGETMIHYRADGTILRFSHHDIPRVISDWKPSIHMSRWASRITLEITDVRVERLNDISEADAKAEGVDWATADSGAPYETPCAAYKTLWESLHGAGSWALNPFVWAISFRKL